MLEKSNHEHSYTVPPINLLNDDPFYDPNQKQKYLENLYEQYGVNVQITGVSEGYNVTRHDVKSKPGTRLSEIYGLNPDLEFQLQSGPIRISFVITYLLNDLHNLFF